MGTWEVVPPADGEEPPLLGDGLAARIETMKADFANIFNAPPLAAVLVYANTLADRVGERHVNGHVPLANIAVSIGKLVQDDPLFGIVDRHMAAMYAELAVAAEAPLD